MPRQIHYNAAEHISAETAADPYLRPAFSLSNRLRRLVWNICRALLYRLSPKPLHAWRSFLLRLFGARMGRGCHFYPSSKVWAPWNLVCADQVTAADGAEIYNPSPVTLGSHVILSQDAYICGATHDYNDPAFPLIAYAMSFGEYAWVCARASVAPGVNMGEGAVLGLGSVATRNLDPWSVYAGVPAVKVRDRDRAQPTETT
ncbi:putative colanic acid biosynthesis acetyltransferase [Edaphobacter sp.]|uniref:putative colanic acid biosynthesis acetyltransferase n=1 Tax=Edaphobacter sp. TaxID=1934404 RepID=UPI002DB903FC|nr:putative colanic acid biosynthesis acetyltransferase [Edaphobacter sp.]HEU5339968.1 putative colanic acid biosynthesis acetyltransferase [Edaphobacter sp.]